MGITISYSGALNDPAQLPEVIAWFHRKSRKVKWSCKTITEEYSGLAFRKGAKQARLIEEDVKGVYIQPPGTETLVFTFDKKGRLKRFYEVAPFQLTTPTPNGEKYFIYYPFWCKTTGRADCHKYIVEMLRELKEKFMKNLRVRDDTRYWETNSLSNLMASHGSMAGLIAAFSSGMKEAAGDGVKIAELDPVLPENPPKRTPSKSKPN